MCVWAVCVWAVCVCACVFGLLCDGVFREALGPDGMMTVPTVAAGVRGGSHHAAQLGLAEALFSDCIQLHWMEPLL